MTKVRQVTKLNAKGSITKVHLVGPNLVFKNSLYDFKSVFYWQMVLAYSYKFILMNS